VIDLTGQSWFWPSAAIVVGLPIALLVLGELHVSLVRRGSAGARPILLLRNYVVPTLALLLLVAQVSNASAQVEQTWTRVVATVLGFLVILLVLSVTNVVFFSNAEPGTWRQRLPSIFLDIGRLVLVGIGLALLFSVVWGADVGGLFAALGVTSIVIGLALQSAVGPVIAGLFLLFEQPFTIGDWLDLGTVKGRVVEVNWRAAHIDTGRGLQIVPNGELAKMSFKNLSRPGGTYTAKIAFAFGLDDAPHTVVDTLVTTAGDLPMLAPGAMPKAVPIGAGEYEVSIPVLSAAHEGETRTAMLLRVWYSARRAGLHLDGESGDDFATPERIAQAVAASARTLRIAGDEIARIALGATVHRYGVGEVIQRIGQVPDALLVIEHGTIATVFDTGAGAEVPVARLGAGEYLGMGVLTRQPVMSGAVAVTEVTVLALPPAVMETLIRAHPELARELGEVIDSRRAQVQRMLDEALGSAR